MLKEDQRQQKWYEWVKFRGYQHHAKSDNYLVLSTQGSPHVKVSAMNDGPACLSLHYAVMILMRVTPHTHIYI